MVQKKQTDVHSIAVMVRPLHLGGFSAQLLGILILMHIQGICLGKLYLLTGLMIKVNYFGDPYAQI